MSYTLAGAGFPSVGFHEGDPFFCKENEPLDSRRESSFLGFDFAKIMARPFHSGWNEWTVVGVVVMHSAFARICAVWLIVSGVSPFMAPVTCDLANLHGGGANDECALIGANTAPEDSSVVPAASSLDTPRFGAVFIHPVVAADRVAKHRILLSVLRL
jgi:hypothetical protein